MGFAWRIIMGITTHTLNSWTTFVWRMHPEESLTAAWIADWSLLCMLWISHSSRIQSEFESESYVATDGQSVSLSWNKAPIWGLWPDFISVWQLRVCWCEALSLMRGRVCRLQLLILASAVILGSKSHGTRDHILLSQIRDFPFRRLLRLAGLRWRYSIPPPHRNLPNLGMHCLL
jgi:hypothetical protein